MSTFAVFAMEAPALSETPKASKLFLRTRNGESVMSRIDASLETCTLHRGRVFDESIVLEPTTKATSIWRVSHFPSLFFIGQVGATSILDLSSSRFVELEQSQTQVVLNSSSLFIGDFGLPGHAVQISRQWVNLFSAARNTFYRLFNQDEKIITGSSHKQCSDIVIGISESGISRRGIVARLSLESNGYGTLSEMSRKELSSEIISVCMLHDGRVIVLTVDNSVILLSVEMRVQKHITLDVPLCSVVEHQSGKVIVATTGGVLITFLVEEDKLVIESSCQRAAEPVSLSVTPLGGMITCSRRKVYLDEEKLNLPVGTHSVAVSDDGTVVVGVLGSGSIGVWRGRNGAGKTCIQSQTSGPGTSEWNSDIHQIIEIDPDNLLIVPEERGVSPAIIGPGSLQILDKNFFAATHISPNFLLVATGGAIELISIDSVTGLTTVWSKPVPEEIHALEFISNDSKKYFLAVSASGVVSLYAYTDTALPVLSDQVRYPMVGRSTKFRFHRSDDRVFLVDSNRGISTIFVTLTNSSPRVFFTSLAPLDVVESPISASVLMDHGRIVVGHISGEISIITVPASVKNDEMIISRNRTNPPSNSLLCMTVSTITASTDHVYGSRITSLIHSRDSRNIVYFANENDVIGAVFPTKNLNPNNRKGTILIEPVGMQFNWDWD